MTGPHSRAELEAMAALGHIARNVGRLADVGQQALERLAPSTPTVQLDDDDLVLLHQLAATPESNADKRESVTVLLGMRLAHKALQGHRQREARQERGVS